MQDQAKGVEIGFTSASPRHIYLASVSSMSHLPEARSGPKDHFLEASLIRIKLSAKQCPGLWLGYSAGGLKPTPLGHFFEDGSRDF